MRRPVEQGGMTVAALIYHHLTGVAQPISPSSHAAEANGIVALTGQFGRNLFNPDAPLPEGIVAQTDQTLKNLLTTLTALGLGLENVLSVRVFLSHFRRDYDAMNRVYGQYFGSDHRPARTCVGVTDLVRGALIELDCIAIRS